MAKRSRGHRIIGVTIKSGSKPNVDLKRVCISKRRGDQVFWHTRDGEDFLVCFGENSPFRRRHFSPGHPISGRATEDAVVGRIYKYSIETAGGRIDPDTKVDP